MDSDDSTMAEQFQITLVGSNNSQHQYEQIQSFCLRVGCKHTSAQCHIFAKEYHTDCHQFIQSLANIPELVMSHQQVRSKLLKVQQNMYSYLEELIVSIDETQKPVTQYKENPNLVNLNKLWAILKQEVEATKMRELDIIEEKIKSLFAQCKETLVDKCFNVINFEVFEITIKEFWEENKAEQALAIIVAAKLKYLDNYCLNYLEGFNSQQFWICIIHALKLLSSNQMF